MPMPDKDYTAPLDEQLCFQLYLASRNLTKAYQPLLSAIGLTYPQYLVMLVLWNQKTVSLKTLGKELSLDSGTLSPLVKRLIEKGLLVKVRDPQDERGIQVSMAKAGLALRSKAHCIPQELLNATELDPSKLIALLKPLKELNRRLENHVE